MSTDPSRKPYFFNAATSDENAARSPKPFLLAGLILGAAAIDFTTLPIGWVQPAWQDLAIAAAITALFLLGPFFVNRVLRLVPASTIAPLHHTQIAWASVLGLMFLEEMPSVTTILRGAITSGSRIGKSASVF